jgi:hypothetical protein
MEPLTGLAGFLFSHTGYVMSETKRYSLSLSRWHAVAERISTLADTRARDALTALAGTTVNVVLETSQLEALRTRGAASLDKLRLARAGFAAVGSIRSHLARANADQGVSSLLAEQASLRRELRLVRELGSIDLALRTPLEAVNARLSVPQQGMDVRMAGLGRGVAIALVSADVVSDANAEAQRMETMLASLSDKINDINRHAIAIELPRELAQEAGLEA